MHLAQLHDIAPPVDYSLVPTWAVFVGSLLVLSLLGLVVWLLARRRRPLPPPPTPREKALAALALLRPEAETPYQFSIRVSDVLRRYVSEQFQIPSTRQTSIEFLAALASQPGFSEPERALLRDFLDRCDLIKFSRYEATVEESRLLLGEAEQFVKGEALARV